MKKVVSGFGQFCAVVMIWGCFVFGPSLLSAQDSANVQGLWNLTAQGELRGCTEETPCREGSSSLCGTEACGPFEMGDPQIYVLQPGTFFSSSQTDAKGNLFSLVGSGKGTSISFSIRGTGISPGIGPAYTLYTGTLEGDTLRGTFEGYEIDGEQLLSSDVPGSVSWSGTFIATIRNVGFDNLPLDLYERVEGDNIFERANVISINGPSQRHYLYGRGDVDWVKFHGFANEPYRIVIRNRERRVDPVIELYDRDGVTLLKSSKGITIRSENRVSLELTDSDTGDVSMDVSPEEEGTYYVKVSNEDSNLSGVDTGYSLEITTSGGASIASTIEGIVSNEQSLAPVANMVIKSNAGYSALSLPSGDYLMPHPAGSFVITAQTEGYEPFTDSITLQESETTIRHISMIPLNSPDTSSCRMGGEAAGNNVTGNIDSTRCSVLSLLLDQRPPVDANGKLYVSLNVPSVPQWNGLVWFRPSDNKTPPYILLVKTESGFNADAEDYSFFQGALHGEDLHFEIGTSGLAGHKIVFETWYLEEGKTFSEENLQSLQHVEVTFD